MNRHVNAISGRLSLRAPQRVSLEILDRVTEIIDLHKGTDLVTAMEMIHREFPTVTDFERDFPSLCFALATGVGKTRLMGAFISYLHLAHGKNNFFVMAPNLTIYNKLIADFTPNTPKYVFKGIAEFAQEAPEIITGDNYEAKAGTLFDQVLRCKVNIFNISKINTEVHGGRSPRIKRLSEYIGESYFARDTTHAGELLRLIQSDAFFEGRYREKVIQVDSSKSGAEEEKMISRLLKVEQTDEPTEIVIHVNMLKEGWDVTNLYTIVPLRAANARILIEQSIGRGLRLPYGRRTGVSAVDRLTIVAHDKFQEIIDEANRPDSQIRMEKIILEAPGEQKKLATVVSQPAIMDLIGGRSIESSSPTITASTAPAAQPVFTTPEEQKVALITHEVIRKYEALPTSRQLLEPRIQEEIAERVKKEIAPIQGELVGVVEPVDVAAVVAKTTELVVQQTIDIPLICVIPKDATIGFSPFTLDTSSIHYQPVERDILIQQLRTHQQETLSATGGQQDESRLEDYLVRVLVDFDDIAYDQHSDLLYNLSGQMVAHLRSYLKDESEVLNVLQYYHRQLAEFIHSQMQPHHWEKASGYEVLVSKGFTALKKEAFTAPADEPVRDFRHPVDDKSKIAQYLFGGFCHCLHRMEKFQSDTERVMALICDRDAGKWFRPARGQFQIFYKWGPDQREYQPDFVAETADAIYMVETKSRRELEDAEVLAKKEAALRWCQLATDHASKNGGKPWKYLLVPHDAIAENMSIKGLAAQFGGAFGVS